MAINKEKVPALSISQVYGKHHEQIVKLDKKNYTQYDEDFDVEHTSPMHWDLKTFEEYKRTDKVSGRCIITGNGNVLGYMLFRITKESYIIARFEVDKESIYRDKAAKMLLDWLKDSLHTNHKKKIKYMVPDSELSMHLFLKEEKLVAKKTVRDYFSEIKCDGYLFVYENVEKDEEID